jgi:hypothetical protein
MHAKFSLPRSVWIDYCIHEHLQGREILRKDNLLDENAPEEHVTADDMAEKLDASMETIQTRFARLLAEYTSNQRKMKDRIEYLEKQLARYKTAAAERLNLNV